MKRPPGLRPPGFRNVTLPSTTKLPELRPAFDGDEEPTQPNAAQGFDADVERARRGMFALSDADRAAWLRLFALWEKLDATSRVLLEETAKRFADALTEAQR